MNEENLVQKYSHTTQISWFSCWRILIWITRSVQLQNSFLKFAFLSLGGCTPVLHSCLPKKWANIWHKNVRAFLR